MDTDVILADQARAAALLADLLKLQTKYRGLPPLAWEVHNAGCLLIGTLPYGGDLRDAWARWADVLDLDSRSERVTGTKIALTARGRLGGVQVAIQTSIPKPAYR